ncbi:ATP-binding protein [Methylobacterium sp. Leaf111]|uniref:ATP-binding protein n=1 Tax=Methylobacterium sp. Leaf111 TaxID=1736257 RepID=UPI0006FFDFA5|nr:ATP-binding protein [Methylobacterium sp. Leaf111]
MPERDVSARDRGGVPRDWIRNSLELRLRRSTGLQLQRFLATVMTRIHGDVFVPLGTEYAQGDMKCDGLLRVPFTVFACYGAVDSGEGATRGTVRKVAEKIKSDFAGALLHWKGFEAWVFATNYLEIPALVADTILSLQASNPDVSIEIWSLDRFYRAICDLPAREIEWILSRDLTNPRSDVASGNTIASRPEGWFFGRQDELDLLVAALASAEGSGAFLVLGAPGIGKTAMTRRLATRPEVVGRFGARRWFVPLEGASTRAAVEAAISSSLGGGSFQDAIGLLGDRPALLVLDNLETPWEASPEGVDGVVGDLLDAGFTLLASMRGLDRPRGVAWNAIGLNPLGTDPSRELFLAIADRISVRDADLAVLLEELGGVPLAIELVAHQAAAFARVEPILREWRRIGTALASDGSLPRGRLSSLDVSIALSVASRRLTDGGRRLLRTLSDLPAGSAIAHVPRLLGNEAYLAMRGCLSTGLAFERESRLNILPPIRRYVTERLADEASTSDWVSFYAGFVTRCPDDGTTTAQGCRSVAADVPNVVRAVETALAKRPEVLADVCAKDLADLLIACGVHAPGLLEGMIDAHDGSRAPVSAVLCTIALGRLCLASSDYEAARSAFEKAGGRADTLGAKREAAEALVGLAETLRAADTRGARRCHVEAYAAFKALGCRGGKARAIAGIGTCSLEVGKRVSAARAFRRARGTFRCTGDVAEEARNEWRLAQVGALSGNHVIARTGFLAALTLYDSMGDTRGRANCLRGLGRSGMLSADDLFRGQRHDEARADLGSAYGFLREAQRSFRRASSALGVSECIRTRGEIMLRLGRFGAAAAAFRKSLAIDAVVGSLRGQGLCHVGLADVALGRSDEGLAGWHLAEAHALFRDGAISDGLEVVEERRRRLGLHVGR